jgi:hypothetical protein
VRLRKAATRPWSFHGRGAATSMPDEKKSQVVYLSKEKAIKNKKKPNLKLKSKM